MNTTKVTDGSEEAVSGGRVVVCWVDFVWLYFFPSNKNYAKLAVP
jgi:hypothetical protein